MNPSEERTKALRRLKFWAAMWLLIVAYQALFISWRTALFSVLFFLLMFAVGNLYQRIKEYISLRKIDGFTFHFGSYFDGSAWNEIAVRMPVVRMRAFIWELDLAGNDPEKIRKALNTAFEELADLDIDLLKYAEFWNGNGAGFPRWAKPDEIAAIEDARQTRKKPEKWNLEGHKIDPEQIIKKAKK